MSNSSASNGTLLDDGSANLGQSASGQMLLWAVFALMLTAISQDSTSARLFKFPGTEAEGFTNAWRSSPFFCLCDTVFDLRTIWRMLSKSTTRKAKATSSMIEVLSQQTIEPASDVHLVDLSLMRLEVLLGTSSGDDEDDPEDIAKQLFTFNLFHSGFNPQALRTTDQVLNSISHCRLWCNPQHKASRPTITTAGYCMSLTLFTLGAIPAAVKIYTVNDVFHIQLLSAIYLSSTVVHGIKSFLQTVFSYDEPPAAPFSIHDLFGTYVQPMYFRYFLITIHSAYYNRILLDTLPAIPQQMGRILKSWHKGTSDFRTASVLITTLLACFAPQSMILRRALLWLPFIMLPYMMLDYLISLARRDAMSRMDDWPIYDQYIGPVLANTGGAGFNMLLGPLAMLPCIVAAQLIQRAIHSVVRSRKKRPSTELLAQVDYIIAEFPETTAKNKVWRLQSDKGLDYTTEAIMWAITVCKDIIFPGTILLIVNHRYERLPPDVQWSAFLLFNVLTFTLYFTLCFGDLTTTQPSWTWIFG